MTEMTENIDVPPAEEPTSMSVTLFLAGAGGVQVDEALFLPTMKTIYGSKNITLDAEGVWTADLPANSLMSQAGLVWGRTINGPVAAGGKTTSFADVPVSGGPHNWKLQEVDAPEDVGNAALTQHESDTVLHGGGQELAIAHLTVDTSTTGTGLVNVTGGSITFDAPAGPYIVESVVPLQCSGAVSGVKGTLALSFGIVNLTSDQFEAVGLSARKNAVCKVRVPTPHQAHAHPGEGTEVTYYLRITRDGSGPAGTVTTIVTSGGLPVREAFIRAYTLGQGA